MWTESKARSTLLRNGLVRSHKTSEMSCWSKPSGIGVFHAEQQQRSQALSDPFLRSTNSIFQRVSLTISPMQRFITHSNPDRNSSAVATFASTDSPEARVAWDARKETSLPDKRLAARPGEEHQRLQDPGKPQAGVKRESQMGGVEFRISSVSLPDVCRAGHKPHIDRRQSTPYSLIPGSTLGHFRSRVRPEE